MALNYVFFLVLIIAYFDIIFAELPIKKVIKKFIYK